MDVAELSSFDFIADPYPTYERLRGSEPVTYFSGTGPAGGFPAELVLLRGAGEPDYLPVNEPRLARAVALAYVLDEPPGADRLADIAESWRPYRTWVSLYPRVMLEEETAEISGGARASA